MSKLTERIILPPAKGVYVSLFKPRDPPAGSQGKPRFSLVLLYPKGAESDKLLAPLREAAKRVAETKWGPAKGASVLAKQRYPIIADGDERYPDDPTFKGMYFVRASTQFDPTRAPPGVVNAQAKRIMPQDGDAEAYSGCTYRTAVRLFPYEKAGNSGIGVGLDNVQVVAKGERLDGRMDPESEFSEYAAPDNGAEAVL
mgnify:CR=1 FL=1